MADAAVLPFHSLAVARLPLAWPRLLLPLRGVVAATTGEEEETRRGVEAKGENRRLGVLATLGDDIRPQVRRSQPEVRTLSLFVWEVVGKER